MKRPADASFWAITLAVFLAPTLPRLVSEGMFLDGLLYSVISRNLASGVGTLWKPFLTPTMTPDFFAEHPPLAFGIQSLFFRALGDRWWVESLYSFATAAATAAFIVLLWRRATRGYGALSRRSWLPVLAWALVPQVAWSYSNNMLENTLSVFVLAAAFFLYASLAPGRGAVLYPAAAAACVAAGLFTKGVVALFPLAFLPAAWGFLRTPGAKAVAARTAWLVVCTAALFGAVLIVDDARENATRYAQTQLVASLRGARGAVASRLGIVEKLALELAPIVGAAIVVAALARWQRPSLTPSDEARDGGSRGVRRAAWLFIVMGACGSLPLVASPRQSGFYLVPSFPFYALGVSLLVAPVIDRLVGGAATSRGLARRAFAWASAGILAAVLVYSASRAGTIGRDRATIEDVKRIGAAVGANATLGACPSMARNWTLQGYFARYFNITIDCGTGPHPFVVLDGAACPSIDLAAYRPVPLGTESLFLHRRR